VSERACSVVAMTTYTVAELARVVADAVSRALPDEIWVQGEIRDLSRPASGHVYFSLVDPDLGDAPGALLPVTLFASEKFAVNRVLQRSGAVRMTDGVHVRIRGRVSHYAPRGTVQLRMTWIDTDFTLGRLAAERERLIRSLEQRGLLEKNRALPLPLVPLRIGLITSARSAAEADFLHELSIRNYAWQVERYDARVQGAEAAAEVVNGFRILADREVDAIAIIRGGGAQTDLAVFDSEEIAVAAAECPKPILTGIGHEIDVSVLDLVARSHKTPTACAAALVSRVDDFVAGLDRLARETHRAALTRIEVAGTALAHSAERLQRSARAAGRKAEHVLQALETRTMRGGNSLLRHESDRVEVIGARIGRRASRHLDAEADVVDRMSRMVGTAATRRMLDARGRLDDLEHRLILSDPRRLLARGWSITRTDVGELVTSPSDVVTGSVLRTTLAGGELKSVATEESIDG